jgi:hypothetical protein
MGRNDGRSAFYEGRPTGLVDRVAAVGMLIASLLFAAAIVVDLI